MRVPGDHIWRNSAIEMRPRGGAADGKPRQRPYARAVRLPHGRKAGYLAVACLALVVAAIGALLAARAATSLEHRISNGLRASKAQRSITGTLLYTVAGDERAGIMRVSGMGGSVSLAGDSERREAAVSSPDGSQIVYLHAACPRCSAGYELRDLNTGQSRVVGTAPAATPGGRTTTDVAWADDSRRLLFTEKGLDARTSQIFLLDERDGTRRPLSPSDPEPQQSPVWSPDGRTVAYLAGGDRTIVTTVDSEMGEYRPLNDQLGQSSDLAWSPDGRYLALRHAGGLWLIDPEDGHGFQLNTPGPLRQIGGWAPGSRSLVASVADRAIAGPAAPTSIYIIPIDGAAPLRLATGTNAVNPLWSPDGRSVAWVTTQDNRWTISETASNGGTASVIASGTGSVTLNSWR